MERLTPNFSFDIFIDNYFTSLRLLIHLEINNIWATNALKKNRLCKCTITVKSVKLQKKVATLNSAREAKKKCNISSGWFRTTAGNVRKNLNIQEQQSNQSHCYNQNMGFVNRMDQNVGKG